METDHEVVPRIQELRRELNELHDSLGRVDVSRLDAGTAVLFQFIALRMSEIAKILSELTENGSGKKDRPGPRPH